VVKAARTPARYIVPGSNLSCGGGVKRALQEALQMAEATHFWILDDDAFAHAGAMQQLIQAMDAASADAAVPLIVDGTGRVSWPPGLLERKAQLVSRSHCTPDEYVQACGSMPIPFTWSPWPSLMVSRRAIEAVGFPRDDFWISAEDLEFSLRLTAHGYGILVPKAVCAHLPPAENPGRSQRQHYLKFCSMLQNLSYVTLHLRHGRRILQHLPGNFFRFFRTFGLSSMSLRDAACAFWFGAARGKTAGTPGYTEFRERYFAIE
jgi:GT2 family glycosyltransferase